MKYGSEIPTLSETDIERFWASVEKGECWIWTGQTRRGYGRFTIDGKQFAAHRVAWVLASGAEPKSEVLDHLCREPSCVNPSHLDDVTQSTNSQRGANGYGSREICRAGLHDISDTANVVVGKNGRQCRECVREAQRQYDAKKREDPAYRAAEAKRLREWRQRRSGRLSVEESKPDTMTACCTTAEPCEKHRDARHQEAPSVEENGTGS